MKEITVVKALLIEKNIERVGENMILIVSLLVALFAAYANKFIKKHAALLYFIAVIISAAVVGLTAANMTHSFPQWFNTWIWSVLSRGTLATAFFIVVMYTGALPDKSGAIRRLMPVRAELSIIATILTLAHNISFGLTYFKFMLFSPQVMPKYQFVAGILSIIMILIMLPLCITSFKSVRKKMKGVTWKKLQRLAYVFYALIYAHVLVLLIPMVKHGNISVVTIIIAYSFIFMLYAGMRIGKALKHHSNVVRRSPYAVSIAAFIIICLFITSNGNSLSGGKYDGNADTEVKHKTEKSTDEEDLALGGETSDDSQGDDSAAVPDKKDPQNGDAGESGKDSNAPDKGKDDKADKGKDDKKDDKTKDDKTVEGNADKQPPAPEKPAAPPQKYKDGTFTGSAKGFNGPITVKVSLKGDVIGSVVVVSHTDDEPYISSAKAVTSKITAAQSTAVNTVSGATFSSAGIINAAKNALASAQN